MMSYPWYGVVEFSDGLEQGDFIVNCPIIIPPTNIEEGIMKCSVKVNEYDVIVISQSCDLRYGKIEMVLVCPFYSLGELEKRDLSFRKKREQLRKGQLIYYHLLNKCDIKGFETDFLVVDFRRVYSLPLSWVIDLVSKRGKRLRLLPPYREHLAQSFARFIMRIGLPYDIPKFD